MLHPCQVAVAFDIDTLPCSLSQLVIDGAWLFRITGCVFVSLLATLFFLFRKLLYSIRHANNTQLVALSPKQKM